GHCHAPTRRKEGHMEKWHDPDFIAACHTREAETQQSRAVARGIPIGATVINTDRPHDRPWRCIVAAHEPDGMLRLRNLTSDEPDVLDYLDRWRLVTERPPEHPEITTNTQDSLF